MPSKLSICGYVIVFKLAGVTQSILNEPNLEGSFYWHVWKAKYEKEAYYVICLNWRPDCHVVSTSVRIVFMKVLLVL